MSRKRMRTRRRWADKFAKENDEFADKKAAESAAYWDAAVKDMKRIARLPSFMPRPSK